MYKRIFISLFLYCGVAQAQNDFVPVMYSPSGGSVSYGSVSTNPVSTNFFFGSMKIGNTSIGTNGMTVVTNWGWEDLRFPAGASQSKKANADLEEDSDNNAWLFTADCSTNRLTDDHLYGVAQMPHVWLAGSAVSAHVHFDQTSAAQTNCWYFYYRNQPLGGQMTTNWTFIGPAANHFAYTTGTLHQMAVWPDIDMTGMEESSIMDWKIFLDGAQAGDTRYQEFDIHYRIGKPTGEIF